MSKQIWTAGIVERSGAVDINGPDGQWACAPRATADLIVRALNDRAALVAQIERMMPMTDLLERRAGEHVRERARAAIKGA